MAPDTTNPDEHLLPVKHGQGDLFICDVADAALKDLIPQMEHPFYSLSKKPDTAIRKYEHNGNWLQIIPSVKGLATIYDKDILIYCISQIMEKLKRKEPVNPALLLFTPRDAKKPVRRAMTIKEVQICFGALDLRERLIAKLAILAGMRPGEIFALTWGRLTATHADIRQRVYRRKIDTPKTDNSNRQAALSEGVLAEIENWRMMAVTARDDAWVFPSERMTPLSKDNCWRRQMLPALKKVEMGWANFLVMRRTHATLMKALGADGKLVADQLGHSLDVNQNVYTQSTVESRLGIVNQLEKSLRVM